MDFTKDIYINKDTIYEDSEIVLLYKGMLFSDKLTNNVYISYGYGDNWEQQSEIKMKPSTFGYLATIKINSNTNLQFCFRDDNGNWDNNNSANYILPIKENEEVLSFKTLADTTKEVNFDLFYHEEKEEETENILETSVVSSDSVEFYETVGLENIDKQTIPDDTIVTQINLNAKNNIVQKAVIKSEEPQESPFEAFSKITEKAKAGSVKAFDDDKVTTGSLYVNSIVKDIPIEENTEEKSLIETTNITPMEKAASFFDVLFKGAKTAFAKIVKLIRTSLNFDEDKN